MTDESPNPDAIDDDKPDGRTRSGKASRYAQREGDLILKTQVAEMRRDGLTFKAIARKVGVEEQRLGEWVREWVRDALDLHPDSGQYILDLSLSRYEEWYRRIVAAAAKADDKQIIAGQGYSRLVRLALDIIKAECVLVARGAGGGLDDGAVPFAPDDVEGEARRLGVPVSN